jgi:hypothetical protein
MSGAISPLPQYVFMEWCLVKHRDNFNFFLLMWSALRVLEIMKRSVKYGSMIVKKANAKNCFKYDLEPKWLSQYSD